MVRKAKELESFDELNVSKTTRSRLGKVFDSTEDAVKYGRCIVFSRGTVEGEWSPKWESELVHALNEAGFIRPSADFAASFSVGRLYGAIFPDYKEQFVVSIDQLSNEQYESFIGMMDLDIDAVKRSLRETLSNREYEILCCRFGLDGQGWMNLESIGKQFNVTHERVRQLERRAIGKLKNYNTLPKICVVSEAMQKEFNALREELDMLHTDPVFKREHEILTELDRMGRLPFNYAVEADWQFKYGGLLGSMLIEELDLSVYTYNCLKRAGFNSVSDILRLPKDDWFRIRQLGRKSLREVIEKMRLLGFEAFNVTA